MNARNKAGSRVVVAGMLNRALAIAGRVSPHAISLPIVKPLISRR
jgi:hypothetical protein